jgi:UDP-N-acetyl-D-mannosaminuronic acid transferase (WecB/TagA/CpsF family)
MSIRVLGIDFRTDGQELPGCLMEAGLVVVPSGPGLACDLPQSPAYRHALQHADWVIPDSGLMVLVWNALHAAKPALRLGRYSGLKLLREVLPRPEVRMAGASFWIMPSERDRDRNLEWLRENGFPSLTEADCYLAPLYEPRSDGGIVDEVLLRRLEEHRPRVIFINVGGGVQEQLGWYLRQNLSYRPAILCTGAAIAFLTGGQAAIPPWADRFYLGWLLRILRDPARFVGRYWASVGLVKMIVVCRDRAPGAS